MLVTCLKRVGFFRKGKVTSRHEPATLISWSLPRQNDVTPYRSPGCADVLRVARADVTDFSYMTLMDTSVVKHNMLKSISNLMKFRPVEAVLVNADGETEGRRM